ncbi:hypothetical protein [Amycolatopsis eburnea]|uniref:Uncharacterized protein n=1 Tax=Amycolatopsis eburnea TaxID=2267691 RepID=A0A3R9FW02_9PSEU|nr:hypothetical protein [Amycolatopsis eburnea]RSD26438.1 hypothetical protein EIY87_00180 [Amycolatopsis eburnea]
MATLCGRCWLQFGGKVAAAEAGAPPAAAVPVRPADGPTEWAKLLLAVPWLQQLRRDAQRRLRILVETLRNWADWSTAEAWPTWARLQAATGWGRSTLAAWLRQLWILGWIDRIEPGSTPQFRPMASPIEGNRAAVYGLLVPAAAEQLEPQERHRRYLTTLSELREKIALLRAAGEKNWTPSWSFDLLELKIEVGYLRTRASELFHRSAPLSGLEEPKIEPLRGRIDEKQAGGFAMKVPTSRGEMLAAAAELRREHPVLGRMSPKAIRAVCRRWWRAGWTNRCIVWAMRYRPTGWSGTESGHAEYAVIHPTGWVRSRLSAWLDDHGRPLPGRRAVRARREDEAFSRRLGQEVHGRAIEKIHVFTPEAITAYGRKCAAELATEQRADAARVAAVAEVREMLAEARVTRELRTSLQQQLIAKAHRSAPVVATVRPDAGADDEFAGLDPVERRLRVLERARQRAAEEGRIGGSAHRRR